ncbi:chromosome segregation protein [Parafrankia irregularis]|uniref:Chromosome partition protein Smc n=1 Tax=Parafrankia irregularis TaxID=795642 RepID=A0A0S4QJ98_9ACTN|nr:MULTISPECIES: AAA family ATPase [Parafrankia]MBE3205419.1 AAA family ATPase [Parafrankia sp. CH37]CUU55685.1 chromosome segregation protein [Parafrankia irregularis]
MHLKSLTLRGFKSFASSTTLHLEPGITCVVGPNGSGKSNVVDAIAWVLGEQGAKALRGGTMSDVIFAGTPARPALGRAEVLLTIDNTDGALPIEYSEVTVGRLMFRSGESEYTINGTACRLLDIQELMSDSGIGRELHVVVGQGQLDAVLHARPEDRRSFIEEAAGVLKHRKRKEKALRKLEAMAANLTRLTDLSAELRRQLGPLGRQAEIARKAGVIQASLRDARLRLLADDLATARASVVTDAADEEALRARVARTERVLADGQRREAELEARLAAVVPQAAQAAETWYGLASVRERLRGSRSLAAERSRLLGAAEESRSGRDPDELEQEATAVREQELALTERLELDRETLAEVVARRGSLEEQVANEEKALLAAAKAASDHREGLARLAGRVDAARSRAASAEADIIRMTEALQAAHARDEETAGSRAALDTELARIETARQELGERHSEAVAVHEAASERLEALRDAERAAERDRASWQARREALELSLAPADGATALLRAAVESASGSAASPSPSPSLPSLPAGEPAASAGASADGDRGGRGGGKKRQGRAARRGEAEAVVELPPLDASIEIIGRLASFVTVAPGAQAAIAAALGPVADALLVGRSEDALAALRWLRGADAGRAALVAADAAGGVDSADSADPGRRPGVAEPLPAGSLPALELVTVTDPRFDAAVRELLADAVVADDLDVAAQVLAGRPNVTVVTRDGDVVGRRSAVGGSATPPSVLEVQTAADEADRGSLEALARREAAREELGPARAEVERARGAIDAVLAERHGADARHRALSEHLAQIERTRGTAAGEISRLERSRLAAEAARDQAYGALTELEAQLAASSAEPDVGERSPQQRDRLVAETSAVRAAEVEARLAVRTSEERARGLHGRADALMRSAANERAARAAAARRREVRERHAAAAAALAAAADTALDALERSLATAATERETAEAARRETEEALGTVREQVRGWATELTGLRDAAHREELARAEKRLRVETLEAKALEEHGVEADDLVAEFGPDVPVPPDEPEGEATPFDRAQQVERAARAEKQLTRLGKINPLALEEFAALQERAAFLSTQLEDLKSTRRDLLLVVDEVDARVREVFATAFADTAREFEIVFATLFPGGDGRLVLTDPDDMLTTGIEVEARPPGKKVKRLSLLSGGERSLTALALLLAIFRARPSPFYVLDEVEAALDDRNLGRLLNAIEGLREKSQLIIITHQKRTMEIADALYGVAMRGDGITTVISQRLRARASA